MDGAMSATTLEDPGDALRRMVDDTIRVWEPIWQSWSEAVSAWPQADSWAPVGPSVRPRRGRRDRQDCGCGCAGGRHRHGHPIGDREHAGGPDPHRHRHEHGCCQGACDCGVGAADLVVRTRVGETRIIPLSITNQWRRERTVEVTIGPFSPSCHEDALVEVTATTQPDGTITLAPCQRMDVAILLSTTPIRGEHRKAGEVSETAKPTGKGSAAEEPDRTRSQDFEQTRKEGLPDVRCSTTLYADVSVSGCRGPLRLAVMVLPRHCDAYQVSCDCGCC